MSYVLIIISLLFNGFFFVYEQKLFKKYHLHPLQVVGYEGLFGLSIYLVFLPISNFIPCQLGLDACVFNADGYSFV
jgi:hypothetical protein